jgi:predicted secreted Zn-dependent protease
MNKNKKKRNVKIYEYSLIGFALLTVIVLALYFQSNQSGSYSASSRSMGDYINSYKQFAGIPVTERVRKVIIKEDTVSYPIKASTKDRLLNEFIKRGVKHYNRPANDMSLSTTEYWFDVNEDENGLCKLNNILIEVYLVTEVLEWTELQSSDYEAQMLWRALNHYETQHAIEHNTFHVEAAYELKKGLARLQGKCTDIYILATTLADTIKNKYILKSKRLDEREQSKRFCQKVKVGPPFCNRL